MTAKVHLHMHVSDLAKSYHLNYDLEEEAPAAGPASLPVAKGSSCCAS